MSMNKKTRSLINTRYEAQKIYYQRKEIKRKEKELEELNNVKEFYKRRSLDYKKRIDKAIEKLNRKYHINEHEWNDEIIKEIISILQGSDDK